MTSPRVRYYADAHDSDRHEQILDLLDKVPLPTEIIRIKIRHDQIQREHETQDAQTVYRRFTVCSNVEKSMGVSADTLVPVAPSLTGRIGITLNGGNDVTDYISPSTHRLADDTNSDNWRLPATPVSLLMALRDDPDAVLDTIRHRTEIAGTEEETLDNWLQEPSTPLCEVEREVELGPHQSMPDAGEATRIMRADAIRVNDNGSAEVVEIKQQWRGADLQKAFGQLCFYRNLAEQFNPEVNVAGAILVIGSAEWSPSWGWPGSTKPIVSAFQEAGIRVWLHDNIEGWTRLNDYL